MPPSAEQVARERAHFREAIHKRYGYRTHEPIVDAFHASDAKTKIISCPARTSQSYAGWKDVLPDVFYHGAKAALRDDDGNLMYPDLQTMRIWIVAPNYDLAKEFDYAWEDLIERREALFKEIAALDRFVETAHALISLNASNPARPAEVATPTRPAEVSAAGGNARKRTGISHRRNGHGQAAGSAEPDRGVPA